MRATDAVGNSDSSPAAYTWTFDQTPPDTIIGGKPADPAKVTTAAFSFSATEANCTMECKIDSAPFAPCGTPQSYTGLSEGSHVFSVRSTDPAGNSDLTPASFTWSIDTAAPSTTITPAGGTFFAAQQVQLSCADGSGSGCDKIHYTTDGAAATANSPLYTAPIAIDATKTVHFFAVDRAGNAETAKSAEFSIIYQFPVTVLFAGTGSGSVTSIPAGIAGKTEASAMFQAGSQVTLNAVADSGNSFAGWSGACTGTGPCTVTMDAAKSVTASFTLNNYSVTVTTGGHGTVTSTPSGITCAETSCSGSFPYGTSLTVSVVPASGYFFTGWSGGSCSGTGSCALMVSGDIFLTAELSSGRAVEVILAGSGSGSVNSTPSGIACASGSSAGCSTLFAPGSTVALTATASAHSSFSGWSGACSGTAPCQLVMDAAKSVTADFSANPANVRIDGESTVYHSISAALDAISAQGKTVRATAGLFTENVIVTGPVAIRLRGGFTDAAFSSRGSASATVIDGSVRIRKGALRVERLVVK